MPFASSSYIVTEFPLGKSKQCTKYTIPQHISRMNPPKMDWLYE
jgi:hypothetical protein